MEQKNRTSGFASMDREKQREIARKGGTAAHRKGTAHEFTSDEARNAGRKGGQSISANRAHMTEIGRVGGKRSAERRRQKRAQAHPGQVTTVHEPIRVGVEAPVNFVASQEQSTGDAPVIQSHVEDISDIQRPQAA